MPYVLLSLVHYLFTGAVFVYLYLGNVVVREILSVELLGLLYALFSIGLKVAIVS